MTDNTGRKLNYHLKSNKISLDKSNHHILTSSPTIDNKINSKFIHSFNRVDKKPTLQNFEESDEEVFKNTIQSINEKDNVNYLIESSNDNNNNTFKRDNNNIINHQKIFKTTLNSINEISSYKKKENNINDFILPDRDEAYIKSTEKLLGNLKNTIEYFKGNQTELSKNNKDLKDVAVKMLKEELDIIKSEKENLFLENKKLKEKMKILLKNNNNPNNSSVSKTSQNISNTVSYLEDNNVPVNKVVESFVKLQLKYDELEKENNYLKTENEDLNRKLISNKKSGTEDKDSSNKYSPYNKTRQGGKSQSNNNLVNNTNSRKSSNEMENLIKEQLKCMQKMLFLVQDKDLNNGTEKRIIRDTHDYLQLESEIEGLHFEESCNITNMTSNSNDYNNDNDNINSSDKDYFDHRNSISRQKFENVIKPADKGKLRENAIDDMQIIGENNNKKNNPNTNSNVYKNYYFNKEQNTTSRVRGNNPSMNLNNYSKSKNKNGGKIFL